MPDETSAPSAEPEVALRLVRRVTAGPALVTPTDEQRHALDLARTTDVLAVGGPGTGKTTMIVRGVCEQVQAGTPLSRMVVLTHARPAAQALRTQIIRALGGAELAPAVMTPHALAHGLVKRFTDTDTWSQAPTLLTAPEQEFRVRELLAHTDTSTWPTDLAAAARTRGFATEVRTAMARVRQLGLDPHDVARFAERDGRVQWRVLADFFDTYLDVLDAEQLVDYAELVHRARLVLTSPEVARTWASEIDQVWCDDMGEYDPSQVQLVADLSQVGARVFAATDPWTGVFGFRGADDRLVLDFADLFTRPGRERPQRVSLTTNLRTSVAVADVVTATAHRLPRPGDFHPGRVVPGADTARGLVQVLETDSPGAEADHIAHRLRQARLDDGLEWSQMAVITRSGHGTLPLLARVLSSHGIPVQLAGDDVALGEAMAVVPLVTALQTVLDDPEQWTIDAATELLRSPLAGLHGLGLRRLGRHLRAQAPGGDPVMPLVAGEPTTTAAWCLELVRHPDRDWPSTPEVEAATTLGALLHRARALVVAQATAAEVLWTLWSGTPWPERLHREATSSAASSPRANRDLDAICALFDVANTQLDWRGERGVRALLSEVSAQQIPADHARESDPRERGVTLTTAHRVKGASWPFVVLAGLQEGQWPATRRRSSLLDARRLTADGVGEVEPFSALVAAERRLFLLAASRAETQLLITSVSGTEGEGDQPSRFLADLGVPAQRVLGRPQRPLTMQGVVAELRRCATDPQASPGLRAAAATRLARLAQQRDHLGRRLAADADPARWWGVRDYSRPDAPVIATDAPVTLGGAELDTLLTCPRQWFLSRQAHAERARTSASSLGSVIHVLVDHASAEGVDLDTLQGHLDDVWHEIPFDAAWLSSSERAEAEAALERYAHYDRTDPRTVIGTEVGFDVRVDLGDEAVRLRGTIDRLEQDSSGRVHIIDFKTGRSSPTRAEAERSAQLGLYQLVTQLGAFTDIASGSTTPGGAELVYLRQGSGAAPKVLTQPSLDERPHLDEPTDSPNWMIDSLSEAVATIRSEQFDARPCSNCQFCPFASSCPALAIAPEVGR